MYSHLTKIKLSKTYTIFYVFVRRDFFVLSCFLYSPDLIYYKVQ